MQALKGSEARVETSRPVLTESRAEARRMGQQTYEGKNPLQRKTVWPDGGRPWEHTHLLNSYRGCGGQGRSRTGKGPYLVEFMSALLFPVPLLLLRGQTRPYQL